MYSSILIRTFLYFPSLCCSSHCTHAFFSWVQWGSLWPLLWTPYQTDCLSLFHLVLFLRFCLILSIGTYPSDSPFCLTLCVSFYVLHRSATSPSLEGLAFCRKYPIIPRSVTPPSTHTQSLEPGVSGLSHVWAVCALLLRLRCNCCRCTGGWDCPPAQLALSPRHDCCRQTVGGAGPWCDWLWGLATAAAGTLVNRAGPTWGTSHLVGECQSRPGLPTRCSGIGVFLVRCLLGQVNWTAHVYMLRVGRIVLVDGNTRVEWVVLVNGECQALSSVRPSR